ncbi:MAG: carboxypeptidase-like regulatory domain-containing protein, partial [Duncaniella sp.]|nr:carboxypeptidase-like regulatory domain-containing protein [Duncaniella sp.]
ATVSGTVLDSTTLEPVPYASVLLLGSDRGALTDEFGHFSVTTAVKTDSIRVGAMGYETQTLYLPPSSTGKSIVNVKLRPIGVQLDNVTARRTREHYSKKDNPAVKFMESIRASATLTDPRLTKSNYNYDKYERISLAINDFQSAIDTASGKNPGQFDFVREYIDTSEITGKPILNLSVREKVSQIHHRRSPEAEKEYVKAIQSAGIDEFIDRASLQRLYEDVMREIDVYQNDITLLQQRFVSPLSSIAPDFYKFYLSDTVNVDSVRCVELTFVPRNAASMGFTGRFYVPLGDSTMFIKRIIMRVPHDINLNFITSMLVTQDYTRLPDGTRLKTKDDMTLEAQIMPGTPGIYARRKSIYAGHNFCQPADSAIFNRGLAQIYAPDAYAKDDAYWESARLGKISYGEKNMRELMSGMRSVKLYYWGEKIIRIIAKGYIPTGRNSRFDIGPITSTFSLNNIEGLRLRLGGITTANLSKRWFGRGYVAYGFKDHKWKYSAEAEYSFLDKEYHSREFPVHSIRLTHLYDMKMLGQTFTTNNQDNMFMSFRRG